MYLNVPRFSLLTCMFNTLRTRRGGSLGPRLVNLHALVLYVHFLQCFSEWESALQRLRAVSASPAPAGEILREVTSSSSRDSEDSDS